ncbi:MAG: hypothetical protein JOZ59_04385, partial [Candidatus Eremiobacteraeota bacterium]|nr:hypothetical protein [Candidatus Eremiobacteraeota bacterium]
MNGSAPLSRDELAKAMQEARLLETPPPTAALRWIDTFLEAYPFSATSVDEALERVRRLRAEAVTVP